MSEPYYMIVAHGRHRTPEIVSFQGEEGTPALFDTVDEAEKVATSLRRKEPALKFSTYKLED
jgi:hypothetical protein